MIFGIVVWLIIVMAVKAFMLMPASHHVSAMILMTIMFVVPPVMMIVSRFSMTFTRVLISAMMIFALITFYTMVVTVTGCDD